MASMVFASSTLSAQSHVKLRTNSNYHRSSCYVPSPSKAINFYNVHISYKNISHIESSKSSFTKGDDFSFSLPKFSRVASTLSPSLSIIKASSGADNIYHFKAHDMKREEDISLGDRYRGKVLLIVNIPQQRCRWTNSEITFLNDLRNRYKGKSSVYNDGFEVLGFLHDKDELEEKEKSIYEREEADLKNAEFPIFGKIAVNDNHDSIWHTHYRNQKNKDEDLWYFLRKHVKKLEKINEGFEKILVDGCGKPIVHYPRFDGERLRSEPVQSGGAPGRTAGQGFNPLFTIPDAIDHYFKKA
ncbi:hypothetical protein K7X08_027342 [Anisodus acutangulus]|uniref:Uncharacterized protein n=1 Tax=Anisodus acutangulus TaxID=402998 RepID=A0A9Q1MP50_9SOLA|nr:hypothetical protein K7X08_027342 [Anisodus acutangulus]